MQIIIIILALAGAVGAETNASTAFVNLKLNKSCRSMALGGAGTAAATEESFIYLNPATLNQVALNRLSFSHLLLNGTGLASGESGFTSEQSRWADLLSAAVRFKPLMAAVFLEYVQDNGYIVADEYGHMDPDRQFSLLDLAAGVAASRRLGPLDWGVTLKALNQRIYLQTATAVVVDAGAVWPEVIPGLQAGLALKSLRLYVDAFDAEVFRPAPGMVAGLSYTRRVHAACRLSLLAEAQGWLEEYGNTAERLQNLSPVFPAGLEAEFWGRYYLRLGYRLLDDSRGLSAGWGLALSFFSADYSFIYYREGLGSTHLLSLSYLFGN